MFTAWLARMVIVMAANAGGTEWHAASPSVVCNSGYEIRAKLGSPNAHGVWWPEGWYNTEWFRYERVDWLGGRHERFIKCLLPGTAYEDQVRYLPFAETPPWLERIRTALPMTSK